MAICAGEVETELSMIKWSSNVSYILIIVPALHLKSTIEFASTIIYMNLEMT